MIGRYAIDILREAAKSTNPATSRIAQDFLDNKMTEEQARARSGGFLTACFDGDWLEAYVLADGHNRRAILRVLSNYGPLPIDSIMEFMSEAGARPDE